MAVAPLATAIVYDRGAFDQSDLALTARIVALSAPLIVTWTVQPTLVSAMNARRRGMILLAAGLLTTVGNIVLDVVFGVLLGVAGVPLATVVVSIVVNLFLGRQLMRMEPSLSPRRFWQTFTRAGLAIMPERAHRRDPHLGRMGRRRLRSARRRTACRGCRRPGLLLRPRAAPGRGRGRLDGRLRRSTLRRVRAR